MKMELIILKCYRIIGDELPVSLFILMMQVKTPASEPAGGCDRLLIIRRPAAESNIFFDVYLLIPINSN